MRADLGERLQHADLVVGRHDRDRGSCRSVMARAQLVEIDEALRVDAEPRDAAALALEALARVEHRLVLGRDRDDVIAAVAQRVRDPFDRQVVGLGGAAREDDLARREAPMSAATCARARVDRLLRLPAVGVLPARGVAELLGEIRQHRLEHARIDGRGGVDNPDRRAEPSTSASATRARERQRRPDRLLGRRLGRRLPASEHVASAARMRSLIRHSGSRTLHFEYWPQFSASVEHAVTVSGPSMAWMMSATEIALAPLARRYPPRVP